eukprot:8758714-Lingulodinium_polyedra.AAC.1
MAGTRSGFETFRRCVREEDPVAESTAFSLRIVFQQLAIQKNTSMDGARVNPGHGAENQRVPRED